jgi:MarR family transcriptional regulator for hemolysin
MLPLEEQFSLLLHTSAHAYKHALDRRLKDLGVGQAGWLTIAFIARADETLSQIELAKRVGVEPPSMVPMINRLVRLGLVTRQSSVLDKRVKLVLLTDKGVTLYQTIKKEADQFRRHVLLQVNPADLAAAVKVMSLVNAAAEAVSLKLSR